MNNFAIGFQQEIVRTDKNSGIAVLALAIYRVSVYDRRKQNTLWKLPELKKTGSGGNSGEAHPA